MPTLVRLDRVLVSIDWDEMFPNSHLRGLGSDASDHYPLLLHTNLGAMTKARLHFEVFWPKFEDYEGTICKVQMARGGVNSLFKNLQASLNNHVSIKDG
jgi:hypothetical protein